MSSSPRGVLFWVLAPFLIAFILLMALLATDDWMSVRGAFRALLIAFAALGLLKLFHPVRFDWAGRLLALLVFAFYAASLIDTLVQSGGRWRAWRGDDDPLMALLGTAVVGVPALLYGLRGVRDRE